MTFITATDAAADLGLTYQRIHQLAHQMNLGQRAGRMLIFSQDDLEQMRNRDTKPGPKPNKKGGE